MINQLFILTGAVQSGKTTWLKKFVESRENIGGILMPIIESKRWFYCIQDKRLWLAEAASATTDTLNVGRYSFSKLAFELANKSVISAVKNKKNGIVIDEIGPLEIEQHQGLYQSLIYCLQVDEVIHKMIIVARTSIVNDVVDFCKNYCNSCKLITADSNFEII